MEQKKPTKRQMISLILFVTWIICFYALGAFLFGIVYPNDTVFIIYCIAIFIIFLIWGVLIAKDYKIEYLFLGKEFNKQWDFICHLRTIHSNYYAGIDKKKAKDLYRKRGSLYSTIASEPYFTPQMLISNVLPINEDIVEHNPFWKDFLIFCLYFMTFNGGGVYHFFSFIVDFYDIEFDDLVKDIYSIPQFSPKLKNLLSNTDCRMFFEYTKHYRLLSKEQIDELGKLEWEYVSKMDEFKEELYNATCDIALKSYKSVYAWYGLPKNTKTLHLNLRDGKRYCIILNEKKKRKKFSKSNKNKDSTTNANENKEYEICYQEFVQINNATEPLKMAYSWVSKETLGVFESIEEAEKSVGNKLNGLIKINIIQESPIKLDIKVK